MQNRTTNNLSRWAHLFGLMFAIVLMVHAVAVSQLPVTMGTAANFGVLAGSGITNTGPTLINGNIGAYPTISIIGFPPGVVVPPAVNHGGDAVTQTAKDDLVTAYNDAAGRALTAIVSADLGGQTLIPGVYNSASSLALTGLLTLDGQNNPNAVFIFQAGSTLITASGSGVNLINGAQACNVFWQVGSSATLGTTTSFVGNILAFSSITMNTGATIHGRVLARNAAVTLDNNLVAAAVCSPSGCANNVPPVFVSPTPANGTIFNVTVGTPVSFTVKASDVNPGPVVLSVAGLPAGATMNPPLPTFSNPIQSTFSWTPTSLQTGSTVVTFTAQDTCGGLAQTLVTIIVTSALPCPNNVPPVFVSPTPANGTIFNVIAGTLVSFTVRASDVNPGPVQLSVTGLPVGATMTPTLPATGNPVQSIFSWTPTSGQLGSTVVTFTVLDTCGALDQTSFTIIVATAIRCPNNVPPVFVSPTPTCGTIFNIAVGTPVSFTVKASDENPGPVQLSVTGLPAGATMTPALPTNGNPVQSIFSWTPTYAQTGFTVVTFSALDTCGGLAQCSFTFNVACADNTPPTGTVTGVIPGPPKKLLITVQDSQSGLVSITVVTAINVTVSIPAFTVGTTSPVVVTATKINQSQSSTVLLRLTDLCGNTILADPVYTTISSEVPQEFALGANYPNPFNPTTKINFNVAKAEGATSVSLRIYDLLGRETKTMISEPMQPGQYSVEWDGTNNQGIAVTSGVYIYRMVAGEFTATRRMTLMK